MSEAESYKLGDKWSHDFDYDGMLQVGTEVSIKTPIRDLKGLYKSMVDVNYHTEARCIDAAIEALESGDSGRVADELGEVLFSAISLARHHGLDAEQVCRQSTTKFM